MNLNEAHRALVEALAGRATEDIDISARLDAVDELVAAAGTSRSDIPEEMPSSECRTASSA
jgi:hypothetical protein